MTRTRLPARRPSITREVVWTRDHTRHRFQVTVGFDPDTGRPLEVFATGKAGSDMAAVIADGCVVVSHALQRGALPAELGRSMLKVPPPFAGDNVEAAPASVLGAIVQALVEEEGA